MLVPRSLTLFAASTILTGALLGPVPAGAAVPEGEAVTAGPTAPTTRVLAISVDGLNPRAIRQLGRSGAPNFYRLTDEGAWTFNARTELEDTHTLANHTGMLTGRRVVAAKGGHGVTWDNDRPGTTVQGAAGHPVASVFTIVHKEGGATALFATKEKFSLYNRSWDAGIDRYEADEAHPYALLDAARRDLTHHQRKFTFLHISFPDKAGHQHGFMSPEYVAAVRRTDAELGRILAEIDGSADLRQHLLVVLTADHGGIGPNHNDRTELQNYRVPFIVWGPGISHDGLYDLNPDYRNPGTSRPGYAGVQPVRNGDVANLAADLLGLAAVPGSELDAAQDLDVAAD